jgi:hypothetical protein
LQLKGVAAKIVEDISVPLGKQASVDTAASSNDDDSVSSPETIAQEPSTAATLTAEQKNKSLPLRIVGAFTSMMLNAVATVILKENDTLIADDDSLLDPTASSYTPPGPPTAPVPTAAASSNNPASVSSDPVTSSTASASPTAPVPTVVTSAPVTTAPVFSNTLASSTFITNPNPVSTATPLPYSPRPQICSSRPFENREKDAFRFRMLEAEIISELLKRGAPHQTITQTLTLLNK